MRTMMKGLLAKQLLVLRSPGLHRSLTVLIDRWHSCSNGGRVGLLNVFDGLFVTLLDGGDCSLGSVTLNHAFDRILV